jgi:hypothetical protein
MSSGFMKKTVAQTQDVDSWQAVKLTVASDFRLLSHCRQRHRKPSSFLAQYTEEFFGFPEAFQVDV